MADICRRLEGRGLIARDVSPEDARRKILSLTEDGDKALEEVTERSLGLNERLLEVVPAARRAALIKQLIALADHWETLDSER